MSEESRPLRIFDGHNDALLRMQTEGFSFLDDNKLGGFDLPKARRGHVSGGIFAVYVPPPGFTLPADAKAPRKSWPRITPRTGTRRRCPT